MLFSYIQYILFQSLFDVDHAWGRYVWSLEGNEWQATLVILRLNRAATSVEWGPQGITFYSTSFFTSDERVYCSTDVHLLNLVLVLCSSIRNIMESSVLGTY